MKLVDKRRMCPNCRAFITTDDKICPYCQTTVGPRAAERFAPSDLLGGMIPHARFVTTLLMVINIGLYIATALYSLRMGHGAIDLDGVTLYQFGAKYREAILLRGEWWRLVTAGFLHGGVVHILMNSWVLIDLGAQVEEIYGAKRLVVIYFIATVLGFATSNYWSPVLSVGASAGIFGLLGAMIALGMRTNTAMGAAIKGMYLRWALYGLLIGFLPFFRVDNAAHIGGLIGGFAAAWVTDTPRLFDDWREKFWTVAAGVCVALTLLCFVLMFQSFRAFDM